MMPPKKAEEAPKKKKAEPPEGALWVWRQHLPGAPKGKETPSPDSAQPRMQLPALQLQPLPALAKVRCLHRRVLVLLSDESVVPVLLRAQMQVHVQARCVGDGKWEVPLSQASAPRQTREPCWRPHLLALPHRKNENFLDFRSKCVEIFLERLAADLRFVC